MSLSTGHGPEDRPTVPDAGLAQRALHLKVPLKLLYRLGEHPEDLVGPAPEHSPGALVLSEFREFFSEHPLALSDLRLEREGHVGVCNLSMGNEGHN